MLKEPNPYAENTEQTKIVQIKVIEVLYNDQVCNLVYMHDLTQLYKETELEKTQENLLLANACISEEFQAP